MKKKNKEKMEKDQIQDVEIKKEEIENNPIQNTETKKEEVENNPIQDKETKNKEKKKNDVKFREKVSLNVRKKWLVNGTRTILLIVILILAYVALNLGISTMDLPEIDVTENKVYSLSDESKKAIEKVDQEVKIYTYGFEEDSQLIKFLKKYNKVNEKITYEILTEANNYEKIKENDLQEGYFVLIFESGEAKKVVDASTEFATYDYTTGQQIDTTEQSITNAILSLLVENKPKVYFTEGHQEYSVSEELTILETYLKNESFETETINLVTASAVPEDCDVLAIMSPSVDFFDIERDMILNYISKGGKIYFSIDPMPATTEMPNIKTILSQYGVSVQNGQIIELGTNRSVPTSPNVFKPQLSMSSPITQDIYTSNGEIWLAFAARLQFESDETLETLNVQKQDLMTSSEESIFVTDLSTDINAAIETAEKGVSTIASKITKKITTTEGENAEENQIESVLIVSANGSYISNYRVEALSANYPLSYIGNNKDFAINCMANLAEKEGLTLRKEITSSTYVPTETQKIIVTVSIFAVPGIIILIGIIIWAYRRKRK